MNQEKSLKASDKSYPSLRTQRDLTNVAMQYAYINKHIRMMESLARVLHKNNFIDDLDIDENLLQRDNEKKLRSMEKELIDLIKRADNSVKILKEVKKKATKYLR